MAVEKKLIQKFIRTLDETGDVEEAVRIMRAHNVDDSTIILVFNEALHALSQEVCSKEEEVAVYRKLMKKISKQVRMIGNA